MSTTRVSQRLLRHALLRATLALSSTATLGFVGCTGRVVDADPPGGGGAEGGVVTNDLDASAEASVLSDASLDPDAFDAADAPDAHAAECDGRVAGGDGGQLCVQGASGGGVPSKPFDLAACGLGIDGGK